MRNPHKRLTVSLPEDLVKELDRCSRKAGTSRSGLVEEWLRRGAREHVTRELHKEIEAYYGNRTAEDIREDDAIAKASTRAARRLTIDMPGKKQSPRRARS
jgi:metal-responsive CopG/Arc/MetJ family transcriptional regulator